ncbi:MAG: ArsC family (seleno)protein [Planctomycetota bacterium]|nr:ArsC family (seleno)protein [Planctomycetota bacterium]
MRAQEFLAKVNIVPVEQVNARKVSYGHTEAQGMLGGLKKVHAARGKSIVSVDLAKEKFTAEMITKLLLGPTGNLRAPAFRFGKNLVVGFNEGLYEQLLGG